MVLIGDIDIWYLGTWPSPYLSECVCVGGGGGGGGGEGNWEFDFNDSY